MCFYLKDLLEDIPDDVDYQSSPGNVKTNKSLI